MSKISNWKKGVFFVFFFVCFSLLFSLFFPSFLLLLFFFFFFFFFWGGGGLAAVLPIPPQKKKKKKSPITSGTLARFLYDWSFALRMNLEYSLFSESDLRGWCTGPNETCPPPPPHHPGKQGKFPYRVVYNWPVCCNKENVNAFQVPIEVMYVGCVYHHTSGVELRFPNDLQGDFCRW